MKKLKRKPVFILLLGIGIIHLFIYIKGVVLTNLVYRKEIKGIIYKIDRGRGGDEFYYDLKNKREFFSDEYFFNNRFSSGIKIGDSVYKSAHNDTLYIYKKNITTYELYKQEILLR